MQDKTGGVLPWVVMTSEENHEETRTFFEERGYFGLDRSRVALVPQGCFPVFDPDWRLIPDGRGGLLTAPDGHGGAYDVLFHPDALAVRQGLECTVALTFQVDNPLLRIFDPAFLGFHALRASRFSTKVVPKTGPKERMGVLAKTAGRVRVIEYSELTPGEAASTDEEGRLRFWAGNVASHVIDLAFAQEVRAGKGLPLHVATKKIAAGDDRTGFKLERFIFDALPLDPAPLVFRTDRREEFGPVKASEGADTPERCREMLSAKYARWLAEAGYRPSPQAGPWEISPLTALGPPDLPQSLALPESGPVTL
jgi:UDP-N-acetylglucosamine/UDP-N-acetylgalactosamine diphosphorylase